MSFIIRRAFLVTCALVLVHRVASSKMVPVEIALGQNSGTGSVIVVDFIPQEASALIGALDNPLQSAGVPEECKERKERKEACRISLEMLETEEAYWHFKSLWSTPNSEICTQGIPAQFFGPFLAAALHLDLQKEYFTYFIDNIVHNGLLGKSFEHVDLQLPSFLSSKREAAECMVWRMFRRFLEKLSFCVESSVPFGSEQAVLKIFEYRMGYKDSEPELMEKPFKKIEKAVLMDKIEGYAGSSALQNNTTFGWLLCHLGCFSLDIAYTITIDHMNIKQQVDVLMCMCRRYRDSIHVDVKSLLLDLRMVKNSNPRTLDPVFNACPNVTCLKVHTIYNFSEDQFSIMAESFSLFNCLESLSLQTLMLSRSVTNTLLNTISQHIKHLDIICSYLDPQSTIAHIQQCQHLTKLSIVGDPQESEFVQKLAQSCPKLEELELSCGVLTKEVAESFQHSTQLTKLEIHTRKQTSVFVKTLVESLPNLSILKIECEVLDLDIADSFKHFLCLKELSIYNEVQKNSFVKKLLSILRDVQKLRVFTEELTTEIAESLRECTKLQMVLVGATMRDGFLSCLFQDPFPEALTLVILAQHFNKKDLCKEDKDAVDAAHSRGVEVVL
ncbi:hypothetical protein NECID01_2143 [Nematocida sp. AWRm77]|nr:hypothetical protein NECID01_2143 [Nematocida sp. AWRm77]